MTIRDDIRHALERNDAGRAALGVYRGVRDGAREAVRSAANGVKSGLAAATGIERLMELDWNLRALRNARYYIVTSRWKDDADFDASGAESVRDILDLLALPVPPGAAVLDIGCGVGRLDKALAVHFAEVHGIDVSGVMVRKAQQRLRDFPNVWFHKGNGRDLASFPEQRFDAVVTMITFQHIPKPVVENYLREIARVLRPGGRTVFQLMGHDAPRAVRDTETFLSRQWSPDEAARACASAGLDLVTAQRIAMPQPGGEFWLWLVAERPAVPHPRPHST